MEDELEETRKYYKKSGLELNRIIIGEEVLIEEIPTKDEEVNQLEYNLYIKLPTRNEYINIAKIEKDGTFSLNEEILEGEEYTDEEKKMLGDMLNLLGFEQGENDLSKIQEQLKEIEAKSREEIEQELEQDKQKDDAIKDDKEEYEKEKDEEEEEKDLAEIEQEGEQKTLAEKKGIDAKNICKIRRDSQFYKNYPNIPKTAYFYLDKNDKMHAEYIDKDGSIQELPGFNEIKDRTRVTSFGNDGQNIKEELPYRVMTAKGLEDKNHNTQDVRIAMYKDEYGYLRIETIHQGRNGEWEGKNIDVYGKDRNTHQMNEVIDEKYKTPHTGAIAKRHEELKNSGFSADGIQFDELSKRRKIDEYMQDGYTLEEANNIYDYVVGEMQLREEDAKEKVNNEIENKEKNNDREPGGRDIGEEAWERLNGRH